MSLLLITQFLPSQVAKAFPKLTTLSMMNNPAAPSYFNGGSLSDYKDYRYGADEPSEMALKEMATERMADAEGSKGPVSSLAHIRVVRVPP